MVATNLLLLPRTTKRRPRKLSNNQILAAAYQLEDGRTVDPEPGQARDLSPWKLQQLRLRLKADQAQHVRSYTKKDEDGNWVIDEAGTALVNSLTSAKPSVPAHQHFTGEVFKGAIVNSPLMRNPFARATGGPYYIRKCDRRRYYSDLVNRIDKQLQNEESHTAELGEKMRPSYQALRRLRVGVTNELATLPR